MLRVIGNIIWFFLAGWWLALLYLIAGVVACLLIITIPFGIASFRLAHYSLLPFGRTLVHDPRAGVPSIIGNILWVILFGWWLAIAHLVAGIEMLITIIGIPFAWVSFKLALAALVPLGARVEPIGAAGSDYPRVTST